MVNGVQEVKSGKHEVVKEAVREVASERDGLKAEVSSLTKKVSEVQSELEQVKGQKKTADQQPAADKREAQVCHIPLACLPCCGSVWLLLVSRRSGTCNLNIDL